MKIKLYPSLFFALSLSFQLFAQSEDKIYGLNFAASELRLSSMDLNTGAVEIVSSSILSPDLFTPGVADFDPIDKRYFYVRGTANNIQIFSVDVLTGETISNPVMNSVTDPGNSTVNPITNIAYNWMDGELYGLNHQYNGANENLKLVKVNLETGDVAFISQNVVSNTTYTPGNSDIDPINRKYFFTSGDKIYTVDLDSGETVNAPVINYPMSGTQFTANLTYNWQNNLVYCLHFLSVPNPDIFSDSLTSELRLATIDPVSGEMNLISDEITSNDGFSIGDCDIDPTGNRYFYIRQGNLYTVSLSDGTVLSISPIENQNNAIAPIINMSYDDLTQEPSSNINMDIENVVNLPAGGSIELDMWLGDDVTYTWQDGSNSSTLTVTEPGDYEVTITKDEFTIVGNVTVESGFVATDELTRRDLFEVNPNPAIGSVNYSFAEDVNVDGLLYLTDSNGRILKSKKVNLQEGTLPLNGIPNGNYFLLYQDGEKSGVEQIQVVVD